MKINCYNKSAVRSCKSSELSVILSQNKFQATVEEVMDWLHNFNLPCTRLNGEDIVLENIILEINSTREMIQLPYLAARSKKVIWAWRWAALDYDSFYSNSSNGIKPLTGIAIENHIKNEFRYLSNFILDNLKNSSWIDSYSKITLNKLFILKKALENGLNIPPTIITNNKKDVIKFVKKYKRIIVKPISEVTSFELNDEFYTMYTNEVTIDFLDNFKGDIFHPSKFQQLIEKKIEIRLFYLDGKIYSMAIFSQRRDESKVDFRKYDFINPDRYVPFKLPTDIENSLTSLIKSVDLNTCSIDLIKGVDGKFYFLEINPVGQFGMVSKPCNYNLEMEMALFLSKFV